MSYSIILFVLGTTLFQLISSKQGLSQDLDLFIRMNEAKKNFFLIDSAPSQPITRNIDLQNPHISRYTIQARLFYASGDMNPRSARIHTMQLGLYTSQNIFYGRNGNDKSKNIEVDHPGGSFDSPYGGINGQIMHTTLFIESPRTFYNENMSFIYSEDEVALLDRKANGIIGLGISGPSRQNFRRGLAEFSIYLAPSGSHGEIIFGMNQNLIDKDFHPLAFPSSENWEISFENGIIEFGDLVSDFDGVMIFDINLDGIGLPYDIYIEFLERLLEENFIECPQVSDYCNVIFSHNPKRRLPDIVLNNDLVIPSELYIQSFAIPSGKMMNYVKLIGLRKDYLSTMNITTIPGKILKISEGYENHIILGSPFLSYYYVSFRRHSNGPVIHIYKSNSKNEFFVILMIFSFVVCALAILGIILYFVIQKKRQLQRNTEGTQEYQQVVEGF